MATQKPFTVSVHEGSNDGPPIEGAHVTSRLDSGFADAAGNITIGTGVVYVTVEHPAFEPYVEGRYENPSSIPISLQRLPPPPDLPELVTRGSFFALADGTYWTAIQCSDFSLLARYLSGDNIAPILEQRHACGFNLLRVWTLFDIPGIGTLTACDYSRIPAFVELCARYWLYVEFCAYTGINDPLHWERLCEAAFVSRPKPLLELVNELDQNTNEPDSEGRIFHLEQFDRCEDVLCSHGSNGSEHLAVRPWWDYETFHTNDASEWQRKVGHNAMELADGTPDYEASHVPILANENTRYADKAQRVDLACDAAEGAALLCAGSCYHSVSGKTSDLWTGLEMECAMAWASGARSVPLDYQDGFYRHPIEMEGPDDLRVYQRVLGDGRAWTVTIAK